MLVTRFFDSLPREVFLAAPAISTAVPVVFFLVFQRFFLSGAGMGGAVKG